MQIILEKLDGAIYGDIILTPEEVEEMRMGTMIDAKTIFDRRDCYLGVRLQGYWEHEKERAKGKEENFESF